MSYRGKKNGQTTHSKTMSTEKAFAKNKVADVESCRSPSSLQFSTSGLTMMGTNNKVADEKSPSISSGDSCAKLTADSPTEEGCLGPSTGLGLVKLTLCFVCGMIFGICFEKGRVFEPKAIRGQMVFENFIMLKMFLSAAASGQICLSLLSIIPKTKPFFQTALKEYSECFGDKGIITTAVGAFVLGIGMTLSGACPGMVLSQVGSWTPNSIFTLLGCLVGALTYGLVAPYVVRLTKPKECLKTQMVHQKLNWPYIAIALPMAVLLAVAVFLLEYFLDWEQDLSNLGRTLPPYSNIVTAVAWRPSVAGAIIGLLQVPIVLLINDTLGGSTSYVTIVSQWVVTRNLQEKFPYLAKKRCGLGNWWQVFYVCGAILGAALSAVASNSMALAGGASLPAALFGGFLMIWGARFAAGCTSGHGLSGMGLLAWLSFIAVPFMFMGGIATGFAMKATGALDHYVELTLQT